MSEELRAKALAALSVGYNDNTDEEQQEKMKEQRRKHYQALEFNKLHLEAKQAAARGIITQDEYQDYLKGDKSNVLQKALFDFVPETILGENLSNSHASGGVLETIGDVLSIPNYFMASVSKATLETGYDIGPFKIGFSPEAFLRNWQQKTDYTSINRQYNVIGEEGSWLNLGAGIATDIAMDPTTYLTLGVSAGSKVKLGAKSAEAIGTADVTLSKTGRKFYGLAGKELQPKFEAEMARRNALRADQGMPPLRMLDEEMANYMHSETLDHMVQNFEPLQKRFAYTALRGRNGTLARAFDAAARVVPGSESNVDALREGGAAAMQAAAAMFGAQGKARASEVLGLKVGDLFNETASMMRKERGLYDVTSVQHKLANAPVIGKSFAWTFDHFDVGWDAQPDVVSALRKTKVSIENKVQDHTARTAKVFFDATKEEMETVSRAVEARAYKGPVEPTVEVPLLDESPEVFDDLTGQMVPNPNYGLPQLDNNGLPRMTRLGGAQGVVTGGLSPRVLKMVEFFESEMDDILKTEKDYGFEDIGTIEGYVNHVYRDPKARDLVMELVVKKLNRDNIKSTNRFAQQRMIATINDVEELFGKGTLELDAFKLLNLRRRASVNLIETDKLLQRVTRDYGVPEKLISDLKKGMPDGMLRAAFRSAGKGVHFIMGADQVYRETKGKVSRLGFKEGDIAHTREFLEYLSLPATAEGRFSPEGEALAKRLGLNQDARMYTLARDGGSAPVKDTISYKPARDGEYVFLNAQLRHASKKGFSQMKVSNIFKMLENPHHPAWENIFGLDKTNVPKLEGVKGLLGSLDRFTKQNFDAQVEGLIPDVRERILSAFEAQAEKIGVLDKLKNVKGGYQDFFGFHDFMDNLSKPFEVRRVEGQLPEVFVDYLQQVRRRFGIVTDLVPVSDLQRRELEALGARLNFQPKDLEKVGYHLFGEEKIKSASQADQMIRLLKGEIPGNGEGKIVELTIDMTPHRDNVLAPTQGDRIAVKEAGPLPESDLGSANESLRRAAIGNEVVPPEVMGFADVPGSMSSIPRRADSEKAANQVQQIADLKKLRKDYQDSKKLVEDLRDKRQAIKNAREVYKNNKVPLRGKKNRHALEQRNLRLSELKTRSTNLQTEYSKALTDFRLKAKAYRDSKSQGVPEKLEAKMAVKGPGTAKTMTPKGGAIDPGTPSSRPVSVSIHVDQGTAKLLQDMLAPDIDPHWSDLTKQMVMGLDKINGFFKSNLVLPWTGSWGRNAVSNTAIAYMKAGLTLMHPELMEGYWNGMKYILSNYSDYAEGLGRKVNGEKAGNFLFKTRTGLEVPMKELIPEMASRGIFRASISDDVARASIGGKVAAGVSGAAIGAVAGASLPRNEGDDQVFSWQNIGSLLGAATGAYLGGRAIKGTSKAAKVANTATRTLQTGFKPMLRAGEMATEIPVRMALFLHEFWKNGSVADAGNEVYRHLNDWNSLGVAERRYIRRAIPFYNWTKLALRQTFFSIAEEPGRVNNMLKTVRNWNEGQNVDPEDIPDYLHEKLVMAGSVLGQKKLISGLGLPIEDTASILGAVIPGTTDPGKELGELYQGSVSRGQFLASSTIEALSNRDSFSGGTIHPDAENKVFSTQFQQGSEWRAAPAWLQTMVGYTPATDNEKERVNATMAWVLGEVPVSRFVNVAKQIYDSKHPNQYNYESLARTLLGASVVRRGENGRFLWNQGRIDKMKILLSNVGAIKTYEGFTDSNPDKEQTRRRNESSGGVRKSNSRFR